MRNISRHLSGRGLVAPDLYLKSANPYPGPAKSYVRWPMTLRFGLLQQNRLTG